MEFRDKQAIYMQIADYFRSNILKEIWKAEEKVPSIRQMAIDVEVNPNTVMRSYTYLQENNIIYNKRGIGYFVTREAKEVLINMQRKKFVEEDLPEVYDNMNLLGLTIKDLESIFNTFKSKNNEK